MRAAWVRLGQLGLDGPTAGDVRGRQELWLRALLCREAGCRFGREHGFGSLASPEAYRNQVPARTYEELAPWMDALVAGSPDELFLGRPVAFERTSGSRGGAKLIPYSRAGLADFAKALRPWLGRAIQRHGIQEGRAYWVTSPAMREPEVLPSGVPVGLSDGAYLGEDLAESLGEVSALPAWVAGLGDLEAWRLATLHALATAGDLAFVSLWSPTFLTVLLERLRAGDPDLEALLASGGELAGHRVEADRAASDRLARFKATGSAEALWPRLRLVSAWADGTSARFARELMRFLPHAAFESKGLLGTEAVVTVPAPGGDAVLAAGSGFFEVLSIDGSVRFAWELEPGFRGEVLLTTASGLYRYRTGDRVECTGHLGDVPRLKFLGRGDLVSDLAGEKLEEAFVAECLEAGAGFRVLVPTATPPLGYLLVTDSDDDWDARAAAGELEQRLAANPHYAHARRLGQLEAVAALPVDRPLARFVAQSLDRGRRPGVVKVPALLPGPEWEKIFTQEPP